MHDPNPVILDPWTPLDYKSAFGDPRKVGGGGPMQNAPWLSFSDRRRMSAYLVLQAYAQNAARNFLPASNQRRDEVREYGDPSLIIEQALSAVLGESQKIVVDKADEVVEDSEEPTAAEQQTGATTQAEARDALEWQTALREWADAENLDLTILAGERDVVTLGDGVYVMHWDAEKQRPRVQVYDPGFYFPVLPSDQGRAGDFVRRVHFLWEEGPENYPDKVGRLVRLTYELGRILPVLDFDGVPQLGPDGGPVLHQGDTVDDLGRIVRQYPWNDEPVAETVHMTQRRWRLNELGSLDQGTGPDTLDVSKSEVVFRDDGVRLDHLDLVIDFLPVVHVPNTWPGAQHFGQSILTKAGQVLDDLSAADTDASRAAATTGAPVIAASGVALPQSPRSGVRNGVPIRNGSLGQAPEVQPVGPDTYLAIRPGTVLTLGENGRLSTVDTSANLGAMRDYVDHLRGRLTQNVRIPDVALGLVGEAANSMSGLAIELRYGPMQSLIRSMRQVRKTKYSLLLKFAQRFMMLADDYDGPAVPGRAEFQFGSFMPRDVEGTITKVGEAVTAGLISRETGILMLQQAGVPIEDAVAEIERIESRDFKGAGDLADATGDQDAVREYLRLPEREETPTAVPLVVPTPTLDPATGLPVAASAAPTTGNGLPAAGA